MLGRFWEGLSGPLAERWAGVAAPAAVFWLGGLLAWARGRGGLDALGDVTGWLDRQQTGTQAAALVAVLVAVGASAAVVERFTAPALRLLEGYWPRGLGRLADHLIAKVRRRATSDEDAWQRLAPRVWATPATATADELARFSRLDQRRRRRPAAPDRCLPTRLGNILRAAESRPADKYGLDAVALWPRLWLVLPDTTRRELLAARGALDRTVAVAVWGLLFGAFTVWDPLALPVGLTVSLIAVTLWAPPRAELFADLLEAAYDLHRVALYQQLRWPLPANPAQEAAYGRQLSAYLWRGSDAPHPTFTPPEGSGPRP
ncbi:hypothetical protein [Streptomyces sp. S.PB5]|uniref:hypothetical protein n=1 Tax=Streptomyces sp. S.PB5 TaxID=3020844 RepID=UPI0025B15741|nr:hypothetical protein [Streptomyces sp. S.PB5]MDN3024995.1 hypothetical protein [Streptomyces sp. S.PB5]